MNIEYESDIKDIKNFVPCEVSFSFQNKRNGLRKHWVKYVSVMII